MKSGDIVTIETLTGEEAHLLGPGFRVPPELHAVHESCPLWGTLPGECPDPRMVTIPIDIARGVATLSWGLELPLAPFFGVMGVAPPAIWGRISSIMPRAHAGNLDNKELVAGTTDFCPSMCPVRSPPAAMGMAPGATARSA
ncbi:MAG TPA: hypothetical protein VFR34_14285 [Paracoccaceae bacterium]|nr:hypothetical protein [Paracoccaceae bacterium]